MGLSAEIRQKLIKSFIDEQSEYVQSITQGLLSLEKQPQLAERQPILDEIFRQAHSLKGSARAVGVSTVEALGHRMEELLLAAKEGRLAFSPELFDLLYKALDAVTLVMTQFQKGDASTPTAVLTILHHLDEAVAQIAPADGVEPVATVPEPEEVVDVDVAADLETAVSAAPAPHHDETIRVSVNKLDGLMAQFSELLAAKIQIEQRLAEIKQMQEMATGWNKEWMRYRTNFSRLVRNEHSSNGNGSQSGNGHAKYAKEISSLVDFAAINQEHLRNLLIETNTLSRQFSADNLHLKLIIDALQEEIKRVRMLPLSTITLPFGRMVRDLARQQQKQIELVIEGADTELDKLVLEQVKDPLVHLLRNAVDHGIEPPDVRQAAGKPAMGRIMLSASQQGNNITIVVQDDGNGLNLAKIRQTAIKRGLLGTSEAEQISDGELANLIFHSSFSTSQIITDISGRGVGLDVVRQNVAELQGLLSVDFAAGSGTTFTMTLPLTLTSSRGLLVRAGGQTFAIPLSTVERMRHVSRSEMATIEGREAITHQGKPVALAWLDDLLDLPDGGGDEADDLTVVIVAVAEKRLGIVVDELVGEQEIVVKSLGGQLVKVGGIAGATLLGSGEVLLVLHTADLVKLAYRQGARGVWATTEAVPETAVYHKRVLVVDDSITTRTLEKNILEAAGYQVNLATNGEEALGMLVSDRLPDLIVSDVNMPRLDGIGMTNRIKHDDRYRHIPIILVTSLDAPSDKARGIEVGADAYIVKGRFDQGTLLETIEQLI